MKVGFVCPYSFERPGGVQNHVLGLSGWLKDQGHMVSILAPGHPEPELLDAYGLDAAEFTCGGNAVPLKFNGSVARINFGPRTAMYAKRWLDAGDFDMVHIHEPITPSLGILALWLTDRPVTATFHTARPVIRSLARFNNLMPMATRRLDASVAVSTEAARVAHAHTGITSVVIGNGLAIKDYPFAPTTRTWRAGDHPRLTFVGRFDEPRKGFTVLTAALPLIRREFPDLDVVVIGHGDETDVEGVRFVGGVSDAERNRILAASDVYVAPQTGRESFGIVLIEALACGTPVVASDLAAFVEVLSDDDGIVGHTFATGTPRALAAAVVASLREPRDLRMERGRARAAQFDWSVIGPQIVAVYEIASSNRYHAVDAAKGRPRRSIT